MNLWHLQTKAMIKIITGINHDKFNKCLSVAIGIGAACSKCYAKTADYGFKSCKGACLLEWCKSGCLSPGAGALAQQCAELPGAGAHVRRPGGARGALDALKALALMLSKALGLISLALELVLSGAQDCKVLNQTVALVALDAITRS